MKVLITGGSSLLGKYLLATAPKGWQATATWYTNYVSPGMLRLDITDDKQVKYIVSNARPQVIIHCAGIASVDYAELYWQETRISNVVGTRNILEAAKKVNAKLVYISTNAVFDGEHAPYSEEDERRPVSLYGKLKKEVEDLIMSGAANHLIIRPILLFGWPWSGGRQNWVTRVIQSLERNLPLRVVDDTVTQPLYARSCAESIWALLEADERGVFHLGGPEKMSLFKLASLTAQAFGLDESLLSRAKSSEFHTLAPRPVDTHFKLDKIRGLNILPWTVTAGLSEMQRQRSDMRVFSSQFQNGGF